MVHPFRGGMSPRCHPSDAEDPGYIPAAAALAAQVPSPDPTPQTGKTNVWREISQELSVDSGRRWNILQQAKTPCENNMEALELRTAQCVPRPEPRCAITGGNA